MLCFVALTFTACVGDGDDTIVIEDGNDKVNELEKNYISIENATYIEGKFPSSTVAEKLDNVDMSTQVMNGAMNYISVTTEKKVKRFFIGVKGIPGYLIYVPNQTGTTSGYYTYVIPVMVSQSYNGNSVILLSGEFEDGDVTAPVENEMHYIETKSGAIEVKLAFSNSKDIDLHLYTPSGEHIYYGHRGGTYTDSDGNEITYGLDIDSNAGCSLDNINKENIYIPSELVEDGTYTVVVNMYKNCQPSIATNWSIVSRYQGEIINPVTGTNPASGVYPAGSRNDDMTTVMTFTISGSRGINARTSIRKNTFRPIPLSDIDEIKLEEREYQLKYNK